MLCVYVGFPRRVDCHCILDMSPSISALPLTTKRWLISREVFTCQKLWELALASAERGVIAMSIRLFGDGLGSKVAASDLESKFARCEEPSWLHSAFTRKRLFVDFVWCRSWTQRFRNFFEFLWLSTRYVGYSDSFSTLLLSLSTHGRLLETWMSGSPVNRGERNIMKRRIICNVDVILWTMTVWIFQKYATIETFSKWGEKWEYPHC